MRCFLSIFLFFISASITAHAKTVSCPIENRSCIIEQMIESAAAIDNQKWRDQTYREIAKTYMFDGDFNRAVSVISKITTPDTKAMTIRGIGIELAAHNYSKEVMDNMFSILRIEAEKIDHPASYSIALTYIAMSQAFAGDNDGAWKTAADMSNDALRYKAYGETAEIQAEKGDFKSATISIEKIESLAFRNKAYAITSRILSDNRLFDDAYKASMAITNQYKKSQALQYMLNAQKPRDTKHK